MLAIFIAFPLLFGGTIVLAAHTSGHVTGSSSNGSSNPVTGSSPVINTQLTNPIKAKSFSELIGMLISSVIYILSPFLVLAFVYVGFLFVQAQGNGTKLKEAKDAFLWTVVGAFIFMSAWGFSKILESTVKTLAQ
jgi:hypothetical protein